MKILITRPIDDAIKLAKQLDFCQVFIAPLLEIKYKAAIDLSNYKTCLVSSIHALEAINNQDIKILTVGERVFEEALARGFNAVYLGQDISSSKEKINKDEQIIYLSGKDITDELNEFAKLKRVVVYEAMPILSPNKQFFEFLSFPEAKMALFFSVRSAKIFLQVINKYRLENRLHDIITMSLSPKIADILKDYGFKENYSAATPTLKSMMKLVLTRNELK